MRFVAALRALEQIHLKKLGAPSLSWSLDEWSLNVLGIALGGRGGEEVGSLLTEPQSYWRSSV